MKYDLGFPEMTYSGGTVAATDRDYNAETSPLGLYQLQTFPLKPYA